MPSRSLVAVASALLSVVLVGCSAPLATSSPPRRELARFDAASPRSAYAEVTARAEVGAPPPLPPGWFVPSALAKIPTPRAGSLRARIAQLAEALRAEPVVLDLDSVPVDDVAPPPSGPGLVAPEPIDAAPEILIHDMRVVPRGKRFGRISAAYDREPFYSWAEGGAYAGQQGVTAIAYTSLTVAPGGDAEIEEMRGDYDVDNKRARAISRRTRKAIPIAGGLAFVYRVRCARCAKGRDLLQVITPATSWREPPFDELSFDVAELQGGSILEEFAPGALEKWRRSGADPPFHKPTRFGMEVSRASAESKPIALVYASEFTT